MGKLFGRKEDLSFETPEDRKKVGGSSVRLEIAFLLRLCRGREKLANTNHRSN
jgi:hypothetical protein